MFLSPRPELSLSLPHCIDFCLEDRLLGSLVIILLSHPDGRGWSEEDDSFVFISQENKSPFTVTGVEAMRNHVLSSGTLLCSQRLRSHLAQVVYLCTVLKFPPPPKKKIIQQVC